MKVQEQVRAIGFLVCVLLAANGWAQDRLLQAGTDPTSGASIRVFQGNGGAIRVEVATRDVELVREFAGKRAATVLRGLGEEIRLESDGRSVVLSTSAGRLAGDESQPERLDAMRRRLARSDLVRRATDLVGRLAVGELAPIRPVLLTTRVFLQAIAGQKPDLTGLQQWVSQARVRPRLRTAAFDDDGPTECWDAYAKEAIAAYIEYEQCMYRTRWWDLVSQAGCATIYEMRAIGAFAWWVKCVGLKG